MSYFKLNIADTQKKINTTKRIFNTYEETMHTYLNSNMNVDSAWNDHNTSAFIDTVKKDKSNFEEYSESFLKYLNLMFDFCDSLKLIIKNNMNIDNLNNIEYNSDKINVLINKLDNCYKMMDQNYIILKSLKIPITFKYYMVLNQYKLYFKSYRNEFLILKNKLINIKNSVENLISKTRYNVNVFNIKEINHMVLIHNYKVCNVVLYNNQKNNVNKSI